MVRNPQPKPAPGVSLFDIPGVREALASAKQKQFVTRENSLLNLTYDICGFRIRTMTVQDYVILDRMTSPFLSRAEPTLDDLAMFLWVMSVGFPSRSQGAKAWLQPIAAFLHGRKVRARFGKGMPETSEPAVVACFGYIETMFYDAPPSMSSGGESCLSYLTGWFDAIQSEYKFPSEAVWAMGLPELFQRLNAIRQRNNPSVPTFNKGTDSVKLFILRGLRSKAFTLQDLSAGKVQIPPNHLN